MLTCKIVGVREFVWGNFPSHSLLAHLDVRNLSWETSVSQIILLWIDKLLWGWGLTWGIGWVDENECVHISICASLKTGIVAWNTTAAILLATQLKHWVALVSKLLKTSWTESICTDGWLLAQLELLWCVHKTASLVIWEKVTEAHDYERYVVVARLSNSLQS